MPTKPPRSERIEARIAPEALAVVRHAAKLQGCSLSEFIVAAAREAAHRAIEEAHVIRLAIEDQRRFAELILSPPGPSPALKRAKKAHTRLIREPR